MSERKRQVSEVSVAQARAQANQVREYITLGDESGPATNRVAGGELPDWHQDVYQWISHQLRPVVDKIDVHSHGGSLLLADILPESNHIELSEGLADMRTFPPAHDTPATLFSEYAARQYTACRTAWTQSSAIDDLTVSLSDAYDRLTGAEDEAELMGALVTVADRLLTLGDHLTVRDDVFDTEHRQQLRLTSAQSPQAVNHALAQYVDHLSPANHREEGDGGTASLSSGLNAGKHAFATIMYARWDASVDDCWPLCLDSYQLTFDRPSPETQMTELPEYEAYGLLSDLRTFVETLEHRQAKVNENWYLGQFKTYAQGYCAITRRLAAQGVADTIDQLS